MNICVMQCKQCGYIGKFQEFTPSSTSSIFTHICPLCGVSGSNIRALHSADSNSSIQCASQLIIDNFSVISIDNLKCISDLFELTPIHKSCVLYILEMYGWININGGLQVVL